MLLLQFGNMGKELTLHNTELFAKQVMPQINGLFENEWQDFRARGDRTLRLSSDSHSYEVAGDYRVAIKVIVVFGNDTTKAISVTVT
mgnify:CR=1 FL=1